MLPSLPDLHTIRTFGLDTAAGDRDPLLKHKSASWLSFPPLRCLFSFPFPFSSFFFFSFSLLLTMAHGHVTSTTSETKNILYSDCGVPLHDHDTLKRVGLSKRSCRNGLKRARGKGGPCGGCTETRLALRCLRWPEPEPILGRTPFDCQLLGYRHVQHVHTKTHFGFNRSGWPGVRHHGLSPGLLAEVGSRGQRVQEWLAQADKRLCRGTLGRRARFCGLIEANMSKSKVSNSTKIEAGRSSLDVCGRRSGFFHCFPCVQFLLLFLTMR